MIYADYSDLTTKALQKHVERQKEDLWEAERNFRLIEIQYENEKNSIDRLKDELEQIENELSSRDKERWEW